MPTYAQAADCLAYSPGLVIDDPDEFDVLIEKAERDVDLEVGGVARAEDGGLRFDPATLTTAQADGLKRATCAQVEYRVKMGPHFFVRGQHGEVQGPDFRTVGQLPYFGPQAARELEAAGLYLLTIPYDRGLGVPAWESFARNIGDELLDDPNPPVR